METTSATQPTQKKNTNHTLTADDGRRRVIVEHVEPQVEGGKYPIKRIIDERVDVHADVYGDGHDLVKAHSAAPPPGAEAVAAGLDEAGHQRPLVRFFYS